MTPKPLTTADDATAVCRQISSMWIGRGARVAELERRMAQWVGVKHAVAFGSGTAALTVAMLNLPDRYISIPVLTDCDALAIAARAAGLLPFTGKHPLDVTVYPERGSIILDFARHLPRERKLFLPSLFGVFSFGALKDVTGGIGGCLVSHAPFEVGDWQQLSPLSDINAAMILNQLDRYDGHATHRLVADGKTWEAPL